MPQLELTELELKALWLTIDGAALIPDKALAVAQLRVFQKVYWAYRGIPPEKVA